MERYIFRGMVSQLESQFQSYYMLQIFICIGLRRHTVAMRMGNSETIRILFFWKRQNERHRHQQRLTISAAVRASVLAAMLPIAVVPSIEASPGGFCDTLLFKKEPTPRQISEKWWLHCGSRVLPSNSRWGLCARTLWPRVLKKWGPCQLFFCCTYFPKSVLKLHWL